ncbi:MAG: GntR family transcriptional regulator [Thermodesulfobacteriota bacterium]
MPRRNQTLPEPVLPLQLLQLDFHSVIPLYHQIKEALKEQITAGLWKRGEMIPSENQLAAAAGVSVGTVKKALAELVHEGILIRQQGVGSIVAQPDFKRSFFRFFRYGRGQGREGVIPVSKVLSAQTASPPDKVKEVLRLAEEDRVITIKRLRAFEDLPLVLEELYLPENIFAGFERMDISRELLYPIYDAHFKTPIVWAEEFLEPRLPTPEVAEALGIGLEGPTIFIERIAYTFQDRPVEFRASYGRGDRFRYHIELR